MLGFCAMLILMRFFLGLAKFFLLITLSILIVGFATELTLFNPNYYKSALVKANIYSKAIELAPQAISDAVKQNNSQLPLDQQVLTTIINKTISAQWLQQNSENIIDQFFNYLYGKNAQFSAVVDLSNIKPNLATNLNQALSDQYNKLPQCSKAQEQALLAQSGKVALNCRSSLLSSSDISVGLQINGQNNFIQNIPEKFDVGTWLSNNSNFLVDLRRSYNASNLLFVLNDIATLILLTLIVGLSICCGISFMRSLAPAFLWNGIPVLIVIPVYYALPTILEKLNLFVPAQYQSILQSLLIALIMPLFKVYILGAIIYTIIGIIFIIFGKKTKTPVPTATSQ